MKKVVLLMILSYGVSIYAENVYLYGMEFDKSDYSRSLEELTEAAMDKNMDKMNQVIIGHSQGGLIGAAYIKKLLDAGRKDIKALITVGSPIVGFAGLDYGYGTYRSRVLKAINVHDQGMSGVLAAIPGGDWIEKVLSIFNLSTINKLNLMLEILKGQCDGPIEGTLYHSLITKEKPDDKLREITDMARSSDFVNTYVRETKVSKVRYLHRYIQKRFIIWEQRNGFPYPKVYYRLVPEYRYRDEYNSGPSKLPANVPVGHVIGTDNDPLRMAIDNEDSIRDSVDILTIVYATAGWLNRLKSVTFFLEAPYHWSKAEQCFKAERWNKNIKKEWGKIIGGEANDGLISVDSQKLPETPENFIIRVKVDHVRSTPPEADDIESNNFEHDIAREIYYDSGYIDRIKEEMKL